MVKTMVESYLSKKLTNQVSLGKVLKMVLVLNQKGSQNSFGDEQRSFSDAIVR